ncbi:carcinoembryonic antigen-related cell adhesion molecule 1-like isoform X2 [Mobula hypostoma]|uniref:carcinoembryonic antigen-related cell adhesion molecule 1-like isoform X2 n=1 Tax=Mobula hypostoma TaxID=723540 RepID=UPI002FC339C2
MPFCLPSVTDDRSCSIDMTVLPIAALVLCFFIPAGESQQFTITVENSQINKPVGSDALFSVRPSSKVRSGDWSINGTLVVRWIDQTVSADNEYTSRAELFTSNGSLRLKSVNMKDSGEYRVNMIPVSGSQSSATITLKVLEPVSNVNVTSNDTRLIEYNDTVSLTCFAKGTAVSYVWLKENSPVTSDDRFELSTDNSTLTIAGVLRTDGPFNCRASNLINNLTSNPFNLTVFYGPDHPKITNNSASIAYIAGSTTLTCSAVSRPDAKLTWHFSSDLHQTEQFSLANISVNKTGNYTCQAYNDITKRFNASTQEIIVLEFVSQVTITSNDTTALENNTVALTCEANGTIQERTWLKDNKIIPNNSRISMSSNNITLSITRIHRNDAGIYTCVVSNDFSNGSAVIHLKVSYGPENIKIQPQGPVMATIGKTLYCSAVSVPVEYKWFKWTNMLQTEQNYTFESVREVDSGNYTCQVYNSVTKESISLSVKVIAQDSSSGLSAGAIAGIVIAVIAVVALVIVLVFWIIKKKAHRLNAGHDKSDPKTTSPENIQSSQTEYAEIERKIPSQPKPTPSSNGTNAAPAQAKDGYVIYTRPNIINAGAKPTSEPMIDNRTDYAEVKYR